MLAFLKSTLDDASADQRAQISALYVFLLAATALASTRIVIALAGRPTLIAFLACVLGLRHGVDAGHTASIDDVVRKHDFRWRRGLRAVG
jgi:high-affinity nickel-transport protein